jgi:phosphoglycolate phosphatase
MNDAQDKGKQLDRIGLVIFDLDGTLIDTPRAIAKTIVAVVGSACEQPPTVDDVVPLVGLPLEEIIQRVLPDSERSSLSRYVEAYRELYVQTVTPQTRLMPEVKVVLECCHEHGLKLAIATGKQTKLADAALEQCGVRDVFQLVIGGDQGLRAKPDPETGARILKLLNVAPAEALVVGDTVYDIGMGKACGTRTCAVTFGVQSRAELSAANPDHIIAHFSELLSILDLI